MSEFNADYKQPGDLVQFEAPPAPTSLEGLVDYFDYYSLFDQAFTGFDNCARDILTGVESTARASVANDKAVFEIPLTPGTPNLYTKHDTKAGKILRLLLLEVIGAESKADETGKVDESGGENPYGRIWWQGMHHGLAVNIIETRDYSEYGDFLSMEVVSEVPDDLWQGESLTDRKEMFRQVSADIEALDSGKYSIEDLRAA